jgi:hypothetical protein
MSEPIGRREALHRIAVVPFLAGFHPSVPPQEGEWTPLALAGSEVELVTQLAERIIPETDTPGARGALVHQYVDFAISLRDLDARERFREGLSKLEKHSFAALEPARQDAILTAMVDDPFFRDFKQLTIEGYYRSEVGMKQELGFEGNTFLAEFEGCTHPEHHAARLGER